MDKRAFVVGLSGLAVGAAIAQTRSGDRAKAVAVLAPSTAANEEVTLKPFFDRMRELGWAEGRNISYERAFADDRHETLPELAARLVATAPDVLFAPPAAAAVAAARATSRIPIVFGVVTDPISTGLVASLPRPGGNVTGISSLAAPLIPKRIEVLREMMPALRRVGMPYDPTESGMADLQALRALPGLQVVEAGARNPEELGAALERLVAAQVQAILMSNSALNFNFRRTIIEAGLRARIPTVGNRTVAVDDGALFAYGASMAAQLRAAAVQVDKVLRGAQPAELPVEQPTVFELAVNLRTAAQLGLRVPKTVLARADRLVE